MVAKVTEPAVKKAGKIAPLPYYVRQAASTLSVQEGQIRLVADDPLVEVAEKVGNITPI